MWSFYLRGTQKYSEFTYIPSQSAFLGLEHITGTALRPDWGTDPPCPGRRCRAWVRSPQHRLLPVCGLLATGPHSRRWVISKWAKPHLYLQPLPITHFTAWTLPPVRSVVALDSQKSLNPTVNSACEGSRLHVPYENLMPDDLNWSWGSDAGELLQIQIIISREVWLHRAIINQLLADISKPYQWVKVKGKWSRSVMSNS